MIGKLRFYTAVGAMAALGLVGATGAGAEPPNYTAAQAVCAAAGGDMFDDFGELGYGCRSVPQLTQGQFASGQAVCEHAYGGTFLVRPSGYICSRT